MSWLTQNRTLWVLFFAAICLTAGFSAVMRIWGIQLIDSQWDPARVREIIAGFSPEQRSVHIWTTATMDVAYPFAYGLLFAGLTLKMFGKAGPFLAVPAFAVIPVDLAEGAVQVMGLMGQDSVLDHKAWLTPLKIGLFGLAAIITFGALSALFAGLFRRPR
jgi:hypothetical protein